MAPFPLDKYIVSCNLLHDWLMSLAMDLAALCDMWSENGTSECHLAVFSVDVALACHCMVPHHSPPFTSIGVLVVLTMPVKSI